MSGESRVLRPVAVGASLALAIGLGQVEVPGNIRYGMITYMHEGEQHIVVQMNGVWRR